MIGLSDSQYFQKDSTQIRFLSLIISHTNESSKGLWYRIAESLCYQ